MDETTAFAVRDTLANFCKESGQKINEQKSRLLFSPNTTSEHKHLFQDTLGISETKDLGTYLGSPLSHKRPRRKEVQFVVDKVKRKLANWKTNYLSRAGKLTLIKATLNSMPAYYLQTQTLPAETLRELDQICNNFLWGENKDAKRRLHLVGKDSTFLPKYQGGLGIRSHKDLSTIYMAKLGWKMSQGPSNLAQECIQSKYVLENTVIPFKNGSKIWKSIGIGWPLLNENKVWAIGNGKHISFWFDNWLSIGCLRSLIHGPLRKEEQHITLENVGINGSWDLSHISYHLPDFISVRIFELPPPSQTNDKNDHPLSSFVDNDKFSMNSAYNALTFPRKEVVDLDWIWKGTLTPKLEIFIWLLWWDRLPTKQLLHLRNIVPSNLCPLCQTHIESSIHIVSNCKVAQQVWQSAACPAHNTQLTTKEWLYHHLKNPTLTANTPF